MRHCRCFHKSRGNCCCQSSGTGFLGHIGTQLGNGVQIPELEVIGHGKAESGGHLSKNFHLFYRIDAQIRFQIQIIFQHILGITGLFSDHLPHLVHDGENGYLFTPGDVDELAAKLTTVLTQSPEERLQMQQASLDGVKVHDIQRTLSTFEALYRDEPLPE